MNKNGNTLKNTMGQARMTSTHTLHKNLQKEKRFLSLEKKTAIDIIIVDHIEHINISKLCFY